MGHITLCRGRVLSARGCGRFRGGKTWIKLICTCRYTYLSFHGVASMVHVNKIMESISMKASQTILKETLIQTQISCWEKMCVMCEVKWRWVKKAYSQMSTLRMIGWENIHLVKVTNENKKSVELGPSCFSKKQTAIHDNVLLCMLSIFCPKRHSKKSFQILEIIVLKPNSCLLLT